MSRVFDKSNSQNLYANSAPATDYPLTIAAWALYSVAPNSFARDVIAALSVAADGYDRHQICFYNVSGTINMDAFTTTNYDATASARVTGVSLSQDVWYHCCGVFSASNSRAGFVNGGNKATDSTDLSPSTLDRISLGAKINSGGTSAYMSGMIAEFAVWNVALTDDEVAKLALGWRPSRIRPASLVWYNPLVRGLQEVVGGVSLTESASAPTVGAHPRVFYPMPTYVGLGTGGGGGGLSVPVAMHHYREMRA